MNPITFNFTETPDGVWAQTNHLTNSIDITFNAGLASDYSSTGYEASMFGHELYHLTNQFAAQQGTPEAEKDAYDFQAKLLENMGITPDPTSPVAVISSKDKEKDRDEIASLLGLSNPTLIQRVNRVTGWIGYPIIQVLAVSFSMITGCYGGVMVCVVPGDLTYQYVPPGPND